MLSLIRLIASKFRKVEPIVNQEVTVVVEKKKKTVKKKKKKPSNSCNPFNEGDIVSVVMLNRTLQCIQSDNVLDYYKKNFSCICGYGEVVDIVSDCVVTIKPEKFTDIVNIHIKDIILAYTRMDERRTRF